MKALCVGGPLHGTLFELPNPPSTLRTVWFEESDYPDSMNPATYVLREYWVRNAGMPIERRWALTFGDDEPYADDLTDARKDGADGDLVEDLAP